MLPVAWLSGLSALALGAPRVVAAPACPSAAALTAALGTLVFPRSSDAHTATLTSEDGRLRLTLVDERGQVLGSRLFDPSDRCDDLSGAIALVLLFWENEPPGPELPAPQLPAPPGETARVRSDVPPTGLQVLAPPRSAHAWPHLALGLGPLGSVSGGAAFGGTLYGVLIGPARRFGVVLTLTGETNRRLALPAGAVDWSRFAVALGGLWQWRWRQLTAAAEGDIALDVIEAQASGLALNDTVLAVEDPGVRLGGRLAWSPGSFRLWAGAFGILWPIPVSLGPADSPTDVAKLPVTELLLGLGVEQELF